MTSVERIMEYSKLPSEASLQSESKKRPPNDWPQEGCIVTKDVSFRYTEDGPDVLHHLNFCIKPKEKVCVCVCMCVCVCVCVF